MATIHIPVLPEEVLEYLAPAPGETILDGTLGGGGHTRLIAERVTASGRVIALDRDAIPVERALREQASPPVVPLHASYHRTDRVLRHLEIEAVDGILLDLGLSSDQLNDPERGFSFQGDGPLDLRFDVGRGETAEQLLLRLPEKEIADVIYQYGEERFSRRIARRIVERRKAGEPVRTTGGLAELVRRCVPRSKNHPIDPATRTFQALRIAVNEELTILAHALEQMPGFLNPGGRLVVISFHSLEDRIVKHALRKDDRLEVLTRKPVLAGAAEIAANPRSRSAKLRAAVKVRQAPRSTPRMAPGTG
ncbi:16S rRNA (cytosine(1402)-N(4))-methyltransferase RsmH [Candidatus Laterigemmans baculatus]|uniref:16S rRNA (cytosine(1402)-N(4))-methyltransferase RsmH n=1 Tax=Candidatus Laterigemmans baculatus TaxID=2770505 RepID=UPI001F266A76|nr:16S rRNA (cytosine(1402)-N(4))-methyltransferase RsmH [Candidatus Laterigemmans baculatus]